MKKILLTLIVFSAGLSLTVRGEDMQSGLPVSEGREIHQTDDNVSRSEARKLRRQKKMEAWKNDMASFNHRHAKDDALVSFVDSIAAVQAQTALSNMGFVLEADYVTIRSGNRVMVNSGTTFISLDGDRAVVQISPSAFYAGPNGMGGVTVVGRASNIKTEKTKRGDLVFTMNVTGVGINASVEIQMPEGSNRAFATVTPNFNSNTVRLEGQMVPYSNSRTMEGMSL
ncbi:MAG: DUF4251 domain-containing protein [Bacteroidales bacterium]|nr:DUF4251 domain-containing protein [Bacteroidales bacterium]